MKNLLLALNLMFLVNEGNAQTQKEMNQSTKSDAKIALNKMNSVLDVRLLALKKSKSPLFKAEMEGQKNFKTAALSFCETHFVKKCEGSVCPSCYSMCIDEFWTYRTNQAALINDKKLSLVNGTSKKKESRAFSSFVKSLCSIESDAWENKETPLNCEESAARDLESKVFSKFDSDLVEEGVVCSDTIS